jgi:GcrA cell cycle regulator
MAESFWDAEERVDALKSLWGAGHSANEIASRIGDGCTNNQVIGKARRLCLGGRPSPITHRPVTLEMARKVSNLLWQEFKISDAAAVLGMGRMKTRDAAKLAGWRIVGRRVVPPIGARPPHGCQYPIGDPGDEHFHLCGDEIYPGKPYCEAHARICYDIVKDGKRRRWTPRRAKK